jgi:head-tail adaptor
MSGYVQAQKLNRRIRIEQLTGEKDGWNATQKRWKLVCRRWAHPKTTTGMGFVNQEFATDGTEVSRAAVSWRIRRPESIVITAGMRVVYEAKGKPTAYYDIRVVLPDLQDNRYIDLGCAIGANEGG